ncbi:MAG TPA: putative Ig domain-containing protein [Blastocatellia bacterium]|nr:putative Ig domain-containing protein [Blastocatellia bacterium]
MRHTLFSTLSSITGQSAQRAALAILVLALSLVGGSVRPEAKSAARRSAALRGQEATDYLKQQGLYDSLSQAMQAARYSVSWAANAPLPGGGGAHEAINTAQGLRAYFTSEGITVMARADGPQWRTGLQLRSVGRAGQMAAVGTAEVSAQGTRASLKRNLAAQTTQIEEWYENRADGLEQGFTLAERPTGAGAEVTLELEVTGELTARAVGAGLELRGQGANLRYDGLMSWDATGRQLQTRLELDGQRVRLAVTDAEAVYPLTIDPTITQVKKLTASDGAAGDFFGWSVAVDGDTIVIGANSDDVGANLDQGSAYIFSRNEGEVGAWGQVKKLTASDGAADDQFGIAVAVDGDTIVVGANRDKMGANVFQGSGYVFSRNQGGANNWGEVKHLIASDGAAYDDFGWSVAVDGDTIVVGARYDNVGVNSYQGSAYIFSRNQGGANNWGEVKKLTASDGMEGDYFGWSVAVDGDTIVVGAYFDNVGANAGQGSAYIFSRDQGGAGVWGEVKKLAASDGAAGDHFGSAVAVDGDTIVAGAFLGKVGANSLQGSAYVFSRNQGGANNWGEVKKLTASDGATDEWFGTAVAVDGDTIVIGVRHDNVGANVAQGSAYVFSRNQGGANNWGEVKKLTASDGAPGDIFGVTVAVDGDTIIVGAPGDDVGANGSQGSAYIYSGLDCNFTEQAHPIASDGAAYDYFGYAVSVDGDTMVVGAYSDTVGANGDQGSVYIFSRNQGGAGVWGEVKHLTASDGSADDGFGAAVAVDGDTIVVGAYSDTVEANGDQGSAYVFSRNQGGANNWGEVKHLIASDGAAGDRSGNAVAVDGDTIVVGAVWHDVGANYNQGSAYVFSRNQGGMNNWGEVKKLTASDGAAADTFGLSVAVSGDTIVVGAHQDDVGGNEDQGSAYVFSRNQGEVNNWGEVKHLIASDGAAPDNFGVSVAVDGDTIVVGAHLDYAGTNVSQGSAYIFSRNQGGASIWGEVKKLTASDGATFGLFGTSVAVDGDTVVVGAIYEDVGANRFQGSAYVFSRNRGGASNWSQVKKLTASDGAPNDYFGVSVAVDGDTIVVGAYQDDVANTDQGSAYVFSGVADCNTAPTITSNGITRQQGNSSSNSQIAAASDTEDTANTLQLQISGDGVNFNNTATLNGVTVTLTDANAGATGTNPDVTGKVFADIVTACGAMNAGFTLRVTDGKGLMTTATISVTVTPNTAPTLSYGNASVSASGSATNSPTSAADNGSINSYAVQSQGTYTGTISVNGSGVVSISNAAPVGSHIITIRATDNCSATTTATFTLNVGCNSLTVTPTTLVNGLTSVPYSATLSVTGGSGSYTLTLASGTLPAGLSLSGNTIAGTPSAAGASTFTIRATDANGCFAERTYTLLIGRTGLYYYPLARPVRLLDTRPGASPNACFQPNAPISGGTSRLQSVRGNCDGLTIPANAAAITGNITTVQSGGGYLTLYPSDAPQPLAANSNYKPNEVLNNAFTVGVGATDGAIKVFVTSDTDVVIDVTGYYAPPDIGGLYFHPLPYPVRLLETRAGFTGCFAPGAPLLGGANTTQQGTGSCQGLTIPSDALALVGNAATVNPQGEGYLTLYPANAAQPSIASSNYGTGQTVNGPFTVGLAPSGQFNIFTLKTTDLVVDITGYYSAQANDQNGQGLRFNSLGSPLRLLDTRTGQQGCYAPGAPMIGGTVYTQETQSPCTNLLPTARALVGNATVVSTTAEGFLTFWPADAAQPLVATSNYVAGQVFNRYFTVGLSAAGSFKRYSHRTTDLVIDISGFFAP